MSLVTTLVGLDLIAHIFKTTAQNLLILAHFDAVFWTCPLAAISSTVLFKVPPTGERQYLCYISRVAYNRGEMYSGHSGLCVSVCLSLAAFPHYCTDLDVTWGNGRVPYSCALLGRFAISAQISLLWQHSAEGEMSASGCTRSMSGFIQQYVQTGSAQFCAEIPIAVVESEIWVDFRHMFATKWRWSVPKIMEIGSGVLQMYKKSAPQDLWHWHLAR